MTLTELKRCISDTLDETTILELLDISAQELVEAFDDKIVERYDYIMAQLELNDEGGEDAKEEED